MMFIVMTVAGFLIGWAVGADSKVAYFPVSAWYGVLIAWVIYAVFKAPGAGEEVADAIVDALDD